MLGVVVAGVIGRRSRYRVVVAVTMPGRLGGFGLGCGYSRGRHRRHRHGRNGPVEAKQQRKQQADGDMQHEG